MLWSSHDGRIEMKTNPSGAPRSTTGLAPALTPHGRLSLVPAGDGQALPLALRQRLQAAFARGAGYGLLPLGAGAVRTGLPPVLSYWRELGPLFPPAPPTPPPPPHGPRHTAPPP